MLMDTATVASFEASRDRLSAIAYRMLGSAADAEDTVQDAFLRWQATDRRYVEVPEAWLTKTVTNLAIDRLRSAHTRHERAVGAWLPEPLLSGDPMLGPADTVVQRESVTLAVLLLMEQLSPIERAVYVLREAFSYGHAEIARMLDITESASQQHTHRARRRITPIAGDTGIAPADARRIVQAFVDAAASGRTDQLVALLTVDAVGTSDGLGGLAKRVISYTNPARLATAIRSGFKPTAAKRDLVGGSPTLHAAMVNGCPAMVGTLGDQVVGVAILEVRGEKIAAIRSIAAPARLARINAEWQGRQHDAPLIESW